MCFSGGSSSPPTNPAPYSLANSASAVTTSTNDPSTKAQPVDSFAAKQDKARAALAEARVGSPQSTGLSTGGRNQTGVRPIM